MVMFIDRLDDDKSPMFNEIVEQKLAEQREALQDDAVSVPLRTRDDIAEELRQQLAAGPMEVVHRKGEVVTPAIEQVRRIPR